MWAKGLATHLCCKGHNKCRDLAGYLLSPYWGQHSYEDIADSHWDIISGKQPSHGEKVMM